MDPRPPPPITITGGRGWAIGRGGDAGAEALDGAEPGPHDRPDRRHRLGALALAAAVGFGTATVLAETRQRGLDDGPDGVLSLDVELEPVDAGGALAVTAAGEPALSTTVVLRNTGPRPVALESAELVGTPWRSDDLAGRRVADGDRTELTLLRPLDCGALTATPPPGPLLVRATTGSGSKAAALRISFHGLQFADGTARSACGQAEPPAAVVSTETRVELQDDRVLLTVELANASARPLALTSLQPLPGLHLTALQDGANVALPLPLPPGDYDPPVDASQGRGAGRTLELTLQVEDCSQLAPVRQGDYLPMVTAQVRGPAGRQPGELAFGGDPVALDRLRRTACPQVAGALAEDPPVLSEQQLRALRRDPPFLPPD